MRTIAAAGLALGLLCAPAPASADDWRVVGRGVNDASQPMVSGSRIVWSTPTGLNTRRITSKGRLAGRTSTSNGWSFLSQDPVLVGRTVIAAGVRGTTGSPDYWSGAAFWTDGRTPFPLTSSRYAYVSQGQDATSVAGSLVYVYTDGGGQVIVQVQGAAPVARAGATAHDPAIASTGTKTWVAWRGEGSESAIQVAAVSGLPQAAAIGPPVTAPGSGFAPIGRRVVLAAKGERAWLAYPVAQRMLRVWRVGGTRVIDLPTASTVSGVDLAVADGRAWLSYVDGSSVCVRRSDPAIRTFGAPTCRKLPLVAGTALSGGTSADLVAVADRKVEYARLPASLTVLLQRVRGTVKVLDAGAPVRRATVSIGNRTMRTNRAGVAALGPWPKGRAVKVRADGFEDVTLR